jgi:hypothetical protein
MESPGYHKKQEFSMSAASYENVLHLADSLSRDEKLRLIYELAILAEESSLSKERSVLERAGTT